MKIAISSTGTGLGDGVDPRFGRAAYLCIYDINAKSIVEVIDNGEGVQAAQGAGITAAALVASKGVETVLTGRVGPKAMAVIEKANIKVVSSVTGTVADAVAAFMAGDSRPEVQKKADLSESPPPPQGRRATGGGQGLCDGKGPGRRRGGRGRV